MSDEVMQDLDRAVRVGLTASAQLAEQLRRRAADADRKQRDAAVEEQRASVERGRAIREEARSHYTKVGWADWQEQATLGDWAEAYQVAHQMRDHDPVAATAHDRIEVEVRRRYNVDIREALQLHLQQVAEDQRIHADRDTAGVAPDGHDRTAGANLTSDTDGPNQTSDSVPDLTPAAGGPTGDVGGDTASDFSEADPTIIPGEVVSQAEMDEARAAAQTAAQGFDQSGATAVRQHRTTLRGRIRGGGKKAHNPTQRITNARRRGR